MNEIGTWYGKPVEELDKPELLNVIRHLLSERKSLKDDRDRWFRAGDPLKYLLDSTPDS